MSGRKINFFSGRHLAPKYVKVVANSKMLVAIMTHTYKKALSMLQLISTANTIKIHMSYKEDIRMGHT